MPFVRADIRRDHSAPRSSNGMPPSPQDFSPINNPTGLWHHTASVSRDLSTCRCRNPNPQAGNLHYHAGTLIGATRARWPMVRSNKAITSSCVVPGPSFSDIRRILAGRSMHLVMNGASGAICLAISRASLLSVRFGIWKLRLPHANDSAATRQWRFPSWNRPCTQHLRSEIRLRASISNSMSPNGI